MGRDLSPSLFPSIMETACGEVCLMRRPEQEAGKEGRELGSKLLRTPRPFRLLGCPRLAAFPDELLDVVT